MKKSLQLAICILCAWSAWAAVNPARPRATPATKAGVAKLSDADLEKTIRAKFAKSKISVDKFEVHVQGGVARIDGRTNIIQHKGTATRMAKSAGAKQVLNKVEISEEARQKAAKNLAEGRRRVQVKRGDARDGRK